MPIREAVAGVARLVFGPTADEKYYVQALATAGRRELALQAENERLSRRVCQLMAHGPIASIVPRSTWRNRYRGHLVSVAAVWPLNNQILVQFTNQTTGDVVIEDRDLFLSGHSYVAEPAAKG